MLEHVDLVVHFAPCWLEFEPPQEWIFWPKEVQFICVLKKKTLVCLMPKHRSSPVSHDSTAMYGWDRDSGVFLTWKRIDKLLLAKSHLAEFGLYIYSQANTDVKGEKRRGEREREIWGDSLWLIQTTNWIRKHRNWWADTLSKCENY